jgi:hypothetical protein
MLTGLNNSITYKNLNLSFLLDMQKEEMFSLLTHGMVTLQECMISAANNELGIQEIW